MARKIARIVVVDDVLPIPKADRIEAAVIGGWRVVVPRGQFSPGNKAVYCEIDVFLPAGNPAWQFLVDKAETLLGEVRGHVLRSVTMKKQMSQGLLLPIGILGGTACDAAVSSQAPGLDVAAALGITKFVKPLAPDLLALARGHVSSLVRGTDQDRIQGLSEELHAWCAEAASWEITEKLEGQACTYAMLEGEFRACSTNLDYFRSEDHPYWTVAADIGIETKLKSLGVDDFAVQGEIIGPGFEGNHYGLQRPAFFLYNVYDVQAGRIFSPAERRRFAADLGLAMVPVTHESFRLDVTADMDALLSMADGPSVINPDRRREGFVFKRNDGQASFKVVSNQYLLRTPM